MRRPVTGWTAWEKTAGTKQRSAAKSPKTEGRIKDRNLCRVAKTWVYDARFPRDVAIVLLLTILCGVIFSARAADDLPLAIMHGGVQRAEDSPFSPADFEFLPGDYLYFTFHVAGFQLKSNDTGEIKTLSLQYKITPEDLNGVALAAPVEDKIAGEINKEDKTWTPVRRAMFLLPSFVASGEYRVHVVVKDLIAHTETSRDYPFRIGGTVVPASKSIRCDHFEFLRSADDAKPVEVPAYNAGDTVYARFLMVGFKVDPGNKYRLAYGVKVLRPDGKSFLDEPKAAQIADESYYPAQFIPGDIQVTTPRDAMHGRYELVLTVRDLNSNQSFDSRQLFTIE